MNRGVIFSYDAILAIALVIALLSGASLIATSGSETGPEQGLMFTKSADIATVKYLQGFGTIETAGQNIGNCIAIMDYNVQDAVSAKVRKCTQLG